MPLMGDLILNMREADGVYTTTPCENALWLKPTQETYDALQHAYDHFNWLLFETALPNCLITLQRKGRTFGYFHHKRFRREDGAACDEIALNPAHFKTRSIEEILSTLAHEMVHLWQFHFGTPGRGRYHNRQWAEKMKSIGLYPSSTGQPDGAELGDCVSHYIIEDGLFARATRELTDKGFDIEWQDQVQAEEAVLNPLGGGDGEGQESDGETQGRPSRKGGRRVKYTCPACGLNAWAKHEAHLICGEDHIGMEPGK